MRKIVILVLFSIMLFFQFSGKIGKIETARAFSPELFFDGSLVMKNKINTFPAGNINCSGIPPILSEGVLLGRADGGGSWTYVDGELGNCEWTCEDGYSRMKYGCLKNGQWLCNKEESFFGVAFDNMDGFGSFVDKTSVFSNIQVAGSNDVSGASENIREIALSDIEKIKRGKELGVKTVLLSQAFYGLEYGNDGQIIDIWIDQDRWNEYASIISPQREDIVAFYVFDEPYWFALSHGFSFKKTRELLDGAGQLIKKTFPDAKIINTFAVTREDVNTGYVEVDGKKYYFPSDAKEFYGFPESFDYIAHDLYFENSNYNKDKADLGVGDYLAEYNNVYLANFYKERKPHQKYFIIPPVFQYVQNESQEVENMQADLLDYWLSMTATNRDVIGMVGFLYSSTESFKGLNSFNNLLLRYKETGTFFSQNCGQKAVGCPGDTCQGNSCWNGMRYEAGTKIAGCSTVTAFANPESITPTKNWTTEHKAEEISYITWEAKDATSLEVKCSGVADLIDDWMYLTDGEWYANQTDYQKEAGEPAGYPGWFNVGTYGEEICIFYPTNLSDGKAGIPKSITISVKRANDGIDSESAHCGNANGNIFSSSQSNWNGRIFCAKGKLILSEPIFPEQGEAVKWNCQSLDGKVTVECSARRVEEICKPDDPRCARFTCKDVYCFDGCKYRKGLMDCAGRR